MPKLNYRLAVRIAFQVGGESEQKKGRTKMKSKVKRHRQSMRSEYLTFIIMRGSPRRAGRLKRLTFGGIYSSEISGFLPELYRPRVSAFGGLRMTGVV